jgi:hypothetical protein
MDRFDRTTLAKELYVAYCDHTGWKSLASGAELPAWHFVKPEIKQAWMAVADLASSFNYGAFYDYGFTGTE